jgi:hypothetical protein
MSRKALASACFIDHLSREEPMRKIGAISALLTGALIGAVHAFPVENVQAAGKCPPAKEGLLYCVVQKAWLPAAMEVLLLGTAAFLLYEFFLNSPGTWKAIRAERRRRKQADAPPFESDTTLLAASWGNKYNDPVHPKPRREAPGPVEIPVPRRAPVAVPAPALEPKRDDPERQRRLERIALALDLAQQLGLERKPGPDGIRRRHAA